MGFVRGEAYIGLQSPIHLGLRVCANHTRTFDESRIGKVMAKSGFDLRHDSAKELTQFRFVQKPVGVFVDRLRQLHRLMDNPA